MQSSNISLGSTRFHGWGTNFEIIPGVLLSDFIVLCGFKESASFSLW